MFTLVTFTAKLPVKLLKVAKESSEVIPWQCDKNQIGTSHKCGCQMWSHTNRYNLICVALPKVIRPLCLPWLLCKFCKQFCRTLRQCKWASKKKVLKCWASAYPYGGLRHSVSPGIQFLVPRHSSIMTISIRVWLCHSALIFLLCWESLCWMQLGRLLWCHLFFISQFLTMTTYWNMSFLVEV